MKKSSQSSTAVAFTAFLKTVCSVVLTATQWVLYAVACDGVNPSTLDSARRELARQLFGEVEEVPALARDVVVIVKGARIGGTWLCALRLLHLMLTLPLGGLAHGENAYALIVGPDMRLARQGLRYALGSARAHPDIARRIVAETSDSFTLQRDDGRLVTIQCLPASRGGSSLRGRSLVGVLFTECAFFRDENFIVNDAELFKAVAPRILPGGQILIESTPWAETGLLYDLFSANHGNPTTAVAAHCPTLLMRPDARTRGIVERERERDPDNASREFDAQFLGVGSGVLLDPLAIDRCVDDDLVLPASRTGGIVAAGADFAFRSDSSAIAVVSRNGATFTLLELDELRPTRGAPLKPSAVVARFADIVRPYKVTRVAADGHYREAIAEQLAAHHLRLKAAPEGNAGKVATYLHLKKLIHEERLRLPRHARLIAQLKSLVARPTSGGGLQIVAPRRGASGHGDLVSALVLACWRAAKASSADNGRGTIAPRYEGGPPSSLDDGSSLDAHPTSSATYDAAGSEAMAAYLGSLLGR